MARAPGITHHGAINGATGSRHHFSLPDDPSARIDCRLFQGAATSSDAAGSERLTITFPIDRIRTLIATHAPINHTHTWHRERPKRAFPLPLSPTPLNITVQLLNNNT